MGFVAPENKKKLTTQTSVSNTEGFVAPENRKVLNTPTQEISGEIIVPTGKTVDGIPTVTLENKTIVEQPKQEVTKPKDPYNNYFEQKFKEFGGNDVNDFENPVNIISRQKAWDATKNFKSKMQYATPEDIQIDAVKNIKQKESFVKEYQNTLSNLNGRQTDFNKSSISSIGGIGGGAIPFQSEDLSKDINNVETLLKNTVKETQDLKLLYQQELAKKTLFGFDPNIDDKVDEISTTITPQNILNTGIELQNVGDIKKQRNLKLLSESQKAFGALDILSGNVSNLKLDTEEGTLLEPFKGDLTEEKYKLSDVDRAYYTYIGGNSQIESLKESTKSDREKVKQIDQEILRISEELGDSVETPEIKKYINSLQQKKKNVINTELKKTQLIDKIKSIVDLESKSYIEYKKGKELQNNELVRGISIPAVLRTVNDLLTTTQVGSANLISKASSMITDTQQEYDLLSEELESRKNRIAAGSPGILKGTLPYDEAQLQKEQAFGFDNEGNFFFNPSMIPALAARTTLESGGIGAYGSLASGVKSQVLRNIAQAGLMYIPTASLFGDRILRGEELKGLSKGQAWGAAAGLIAIETISELANPFEMSLFAGKPKLLSDVSISDVQRIAYKEGLRKTFGSNKYDKLVDLLTDSKIFAKEAFKQGNMEYLEEGIGALGGAAESQLINHYNPEYSTENELNLQDQIVSYLSTQVGMLPMGGVAGYYAVKEANKTALFMAAESPEMFVQGIKKDLQKGTITPFEANKRLKLVEQASLIKTQLTDAFKNIDKAVTESGKPIDEASKQAAKLDLFNTAYNKDDLEKRILAEPSDKKKDVLLKELDETLELFSEKLQQTKKPKKEASVKQIQEKLLNDDYSDKYINSFINPENIQNKIKELVVEKDKFQDEEIQKLYDDKISKFQERLKTATEESKPKEVVVEKQGLSYLKEKVKEGTISEKEIEDLDEPGIAEKVAELKKKEKEKEALVKVEEISKIKTAKERQIAIDELRPQLEEQELYTALDELEKVEKNEKIDTDLTATFGVKPVEEIPTEEQTQEDSVGVGKLSSEKTELYSVPILLDPNAKVRGDKQEYITREVFDKAFANDDKEGAKFQSAETLIRRGGYSTNELNQLLPNWRELLPKETPQEDSVSVGGDVKQFNIAKEGSLKRIKNSNDPQTIFSEINRLQEAMKVTKGAELTPKEQTLIDEKLKELKDKGYTFKTKKGEILRDGENIQIDDNVVLLKPSDVKDNEKILIQKELNRRINLKQDLIKNGYTEEEAILGSRLNEDINIVSRDLEVTVLKNGIQEKSGKVTIRFISAKDAEQSLKETPQSGSVSLEDKKADIEKRRQEALKPYDERDARSLEAVTPNNPNHPTIKVGMKRADGLNVIVEKTNTNNWNGEGEGYTIITAVKSPAEFDSNGVMTKAAKVEEAVFNSKEEAEDAVQATFEKVKSLAGKKQKEINTKYDAELDALEQPNEETIVLEEELTADENNTTETTTLKPEEAPNEKSDKKIAEELADIVENPANPLTTMVFQPPSLISKIWNSTLQKIQNLVETSGKTYLEQGYTVSIVNSQEIPFDNFDDDTKKYFSKGFKDGEYVEDEQKRKKDDGKLAVITNEKGEFLYFDENGNKSTTFKKGYKLAISNIPKVVEKTAYKPTEKQLSLIGETEKWYKRQVERLKNLRDVKPGERKTLIIEKISTNDNTLSNTPKNLKEFKNQVVSITNNNGRISIKIEGRKKDIGLVRRKLNEEEATSLANILLSKAKDKPFYDGLPEHLQKLTDRLDYVKKFITTGLNYYHKINGKNTWIDLSLGKNGDKPGVYVKIGSKDAEWRLLTYEETVRLFKEIDHNILSNYPVNSDFEVFNFNGKSFVKAEPSTYGNYLVENFPSYQRVTIVGKTEDSYIEFGSEIGSNEANLTQPTEEKELPTEKIVTEQPVVNPAIQENPATEEKQEKDVRIVRHETKKSNLSEMERSKELTSEVTEQQDKEAKEWYDSNPISQFISFNHFKNIVNSTAFATWSASAITLWKGGNFTDLYHEAWHEFSQLYLTKAQKIDLYNEAMQTNEGKKTIEQYAKKLKKSVSELEDNEIYFAIEEMVAEDFRKYVLSFKEGNPLILNQRPKRNTYFRKIVNYLKELITGKTDIQTYYERLYTGNISKYNRSLDNAFFGVLNRGLEGTLYDKKITLTSKDSKNLFKAVDALINKTLESFNKPLTLIFDNPKALDAIYTEVLNEFKNLHSKRLSEYETETDEVKKEGIGRILDNLQFIIENWDNKTLNGKVIQKGLKYQHKDFSEFFAIAKEKLSFEEADVDSLAEIDEDFANEDLEDIENSRNASIVKNENVSSREGASNEVLYLIASLSKYDSNGVIMDNEFIPGIPDIIDFKNTWDILSQNLSGISDYKQMIQKIKELSLRHKQFEDLLNRLPKENQIELTPSQLRLRNAFINDLSKPSVFVQEVVVKMDKNGNAEFGYHPAGFKAEKLLKDEFSRNFKNDTENNNPFVKDFRGETYLNFQFLVQEFEKYFTTNLKEYNELLNTLGKEQLFLERIAFLQTIGFNFSPATLADEEFINEVVSKNGAVQNIYVALKEANKKLNEETAPKKLLNPNLPNQIRNKENEVKQAYDNNVSAENIEKLENSLNNLYLEYKNTSGLIFDPIEIISNSKYGDSGGRVNTIIRLEIKNSDKLFAQSVKNAEQNTVWQIRQWSYITKIYNALNDVETYPTYQKLRESQWLKQLDIEANPYAEGITLHSLFDLDPLSETYQQRRKTTDGNVVKIELQDYNGLRANLQTGATNPGKTTVRLTPFEKLIQNFNTLLLNGVQEHLRYGDKSSSFATFVSGYITNKVNGKINNKERLIIGIEDFDKLVPNKALVILKMYLRAEMQPMYNNLKYGIGNDVTHYKENIKELGIFEGVLSEKTQQKVKNILKELVNSKEEVTKKTFETKIESINEDLEKDFNNYFKQQVKDIDSNFNTVNKILSVKNFLDKKLLKRTNNNTTQLKYAYVVNSFLYNVEHTKLITQDPRFYKASGDKLDPFKRFSQYSATGTLFVVDEATNRFIDKIGRGLRDSLVESGVKLKNDKENGTILSVIFKDNKYSSELFEVYKDHFINKLGYSIEKASEILKAYLDINEADGQGFVTLDELRESKKREGSSHWSNAHEVAYWKEVDFFAGKTTEGMSPEERILFSPEKWQYSGTSVKDINGKSIVIPVFYKFSVMPLIPSAIKNTPFEEIHKNLIRQNVGLALFESGSKHASFQNEEGEFNKFFENNKERTPFTGDYTINTIFYQYLKEQVNIEPELKEKVTFSTQMRKLITLNLFNNGIPNDYKGTKDWFSLTSEEKLKESNFFKLQNQMSNIVDKLIGIERSNIINEVGAKWDESKKEYFINPEKLSQFLQKEFVKRGLPDEAIEYIESTQNGKFKNPLDASTQREKIEKILYAVADKRLVQQKITGENLIQVASTGFEVNDQKFRKPTTEELKKYNFGSSDLMGYLPEGRVKKDGKKVTAASKIKLGFTTRWEYLLDLDDNEGNPIKIKKPGTEKVDYEASIAKLNSLIKDDVWLDKGNNRKMITLVGVRIPVQGLNSQEFMEVFQFLPPSLGNVIIVHPELVAKSGGDFDIDKLTTFFPNLKINPITNKVELYEEVPDKALENLYKYLTDKFEKKMADDESVNNLIATIFDIDATILTKEQKKEAVEEIFKENKLPSLEQFKNKYKKKAYENQLISTIREILEDPANFNQLTRPNDTDLLKPFADEIKKEETKTDKTPDEKTGLKRRNVWSNIVEFRTILEQFKSNLVGKSNLGIAAVNNTFFSLAQNAGLTLNDSYVTKNKKNQEQVFKVRVNFSHNTIIKNGVSKISISGLKDWRAGVENLKNEANYISDVISQFINGFVDVAKDDWVFYINAVKEYVPTMLFLNMAGVDNETNIAYFTTPIMREYIKEFQKYRNIFVMMKNRNDYNFAKRIAIQDILISKLDEIKDEELKKEIEDIQSLQKEYDLIEDKKQKTSASINKNRKITSVIELLQEKANKNKELFTKEKMKGKLSAEEELMLLAHFEELNKLAGYVTDLGRSLNADTAKTGDSFSVQTRINKKENLLDLDLFDEDAVNRMFNESNVKGFTNTKSGVDSFVSKLFQNVFEVLGTENFNKWLTEKLKDGRLAFEYTKTKSSELVKAIKSDFITYLFQNNVFYENKNDLVVDVVKSNFRRFKSISVAFEKFKTKYEALKDEYPTIFQLKPIATQIKGKNEEGKEIVTDEFYNLVLSNPLVETDEINNAVKQMRALANFNDAKYTKEQQLEIQDFAKKLINFMIIQSSGRTDRFNLMNLVPSEFYSPKIAKAIEGAGNFLKNGDFSDLNRFWNKFITERGNFFGGLSFKKPYSNYKSVLASDSTGEKSRVNLAKFTEAVEKLPQKTETVKETRNSSLIKSSPDKLFVISSLNNKQAEKEKDQLNKAGLQNFTHITFEGINDLNYNEKVQSIIQNLVKAAVESKGNIVLSQSGYAKELLEKNPIAFNYVSKQLFDIFGFTNPGYIPITQERIIKKYPKEIKIEGFSLNSQDLQKIASFNSVTEEKAITDNEIEFYPNGIQRLNEYEYIDKNTADQLKDVSKTLETLMNAYEADNRDEIQDLRIFEYVNKLLNENLQLIDRNQLSLFTDEELDKLPDCV